MLILAIYGVIGIVVLWLGILFYLRSVQSRKWYQCPSCGERFRVELMDASRCNSCGTPLR